jgi:hypothetical protein
MVQDIPEMAEMGLNLVKVLPAGQECGAVDARVLLQSGEEWSLTAAWPPVRLAARPWRQRPLECRERHLPIRGFRRPLLWFIAVCLSL